MSKVSVTKDKLDILANAIANKSGEPLTLTLDEGWDEIIIIRGDQCQQ